MTTEVEQFLSNHIQTKTVHSTESLRTILMGLSNNYGMFSFDEEQQDFANKSANFDKFSQAIGRTSWGRNQFIEWWKNPPATLRASTNTTGASRDFTEAGTLPTPEAAHAAWEAQAPKGWADGIAFVKPWDSAPRVPTVEYALEVWHKDNIIQYVPWQGVPPIYLLGMRLEIDDDWYIVKSSDACIANLDNGDIKVTHRLFVQ